MKTTNNTMVWLLVRGDSQVTCFDEYGRDVGTPQDWGHQSGWGNYCELFRAEDFESFAFVKYEGRRYSGQGFAQAAKGWGCPLPRMLAGIVGAEEGSKRFSEFLRELRPEARDVVTIPALMFHLRGRAIPWGELGRIRSLGEWERFCRRWEIEMPEWDAEVSWIEPRHLRALGTLLG